MTPRCYKDFLLKEKEESQSLADAWVPRGDKKLSTLLKEMEPFKLNQEDVPLVIRAVENPEWFTSKLFTGAVDLFTHDCIHILLGRGLLPKDEAFVIGYTMGSSKKMARWRRNLFMFCAKHLYPQAYRFGEEERFVFNLAVVAGSKCNIDLSKVDFHKMIDMRVSELRKKLQVSYEVIKYCYGLESNCFDSVESERLLKR